MYRRLAISIVACLTLSAGFALWAEAGNPKTGEADHLSTYRWQIHEGWFGGFSGLEVSDDGTRLVTISDRGHIVTADISRARGDIVGLVNVTQFKLLNPEGAFPAQPTRRDSEGLAQLPSGQLVVSYEGNHRLERRASPDALPAPLPRDAWFKTMAANSGFEALAVSSDGRLFAMPEAAVEDTNRIQVYTLLGSHWHPAFTLNRDTKFQPVGADFGPDGRFYVLERGFNGIGFRTRARSFRIDGTEANDEKLLFRNGIGGHDNLEGISVWRDSEGRIRLTMISDDNFRLIQRTEIVEYVIPQ
ncbi:esterase-like activity of phytase family protein [Shimia sp. R10_1]|uniref:esterase-like activity of phytase family protein n=1 Tax=Shimia sp. R10_1 TaxID=2821095 RepID=UPI001ADB3E5E|nr:esterase-like activity of phytase family protein [Shimia sp. R10_1]MBO9473111.1 esterase-like activity of phytase family protein [Shimia sp. R10_1]